MFSAEGWGTIQFLVGTTIQILIYPLLKPNFKFNILDHNVLIFGLEYHIEKSAAQMNGH